MTNQKGYDRRQDQKRKGAVAYGRCIDPGKAGDKLLGAGFVGTGVFHKLQNLGNGGFSEGLGGADL